MLLCSFGLVPTFVPLVAQAHAKLRKCDRIRRISVTLPQIIRFHATSSRTKTDEGVEAVDIFEYGKL